jgi:multidrug efflux pump subunit AcrA (membrane-fusion protein)
MSKLAKIAPIVVILACAGSLFFAFKLDGVKRQLNADNKQLSDDVAAAKTQQTQTQQKLDQDAKLLQKAQDDLGAANANMQAAQVALTEKTKEAEEAKTKVSALDQQFQETKTKLTTAEDTLRQIQIATKTEDMQNIGQIREKLTALGDENKVLSEQLTSMRDENVRIKQELAEKTMTPVGVRGRVTVVQPSWGFLVLNIGERDSVRPDSEFLVYRDSKMIGKVQIVSVNQTTSIAQILPDYQRGMPRQGDLVIH